MKQTNNFLNNQKYIFGKSEKRKILTMYLGGIKDKVFLTYLSYFTTISIGIIFPLGLIIIGIKTFLYVDKNLSIIFFLLAVGNFYLLYLAYKSVQPLQIVKNFFVIENNNIVYKTINILFLIVLIIYFFMFIGRLSDSSDTWNGILVFLYFFGFIILFISLFLKYFLNNYYFKMNVLHIVLAPVVFLLGGVLFGLTYIFLSFKNFTIQKTLRKQNNLFKDYYQISKL